MKILLTGGTGFLGRVILRSYEEILTLGRGDSDIICDFSNSVPRITDSFDIIIHAGGKAHSVPKTIKETDEFFKSNVDGTSHLLQGLERGSSFPKSFVFISTIAVYGKEFGNLIDEESPLLAKNAYGLSKIQAEKIIKEWCDKNKIVCTILRLPLIAGPNPPGNLNAMINGISKGFYFNIDGGKAIKSVVLAEDVAQIILKAASIGGIYNLTDGHHPSFAALSELIALQLGKRKPKNIPFWMASLMAKVGDILGKNAPINSDKLRKITSDLTFDDSKARKILGWKPRSVLKDFKIK